VALRINTHHPFYLVGNGGAHDDFSWFDRQKLESLGFDFTRRGKEGGHDFHQRMLPRRTYAVLEFAGPAWDGWKKRLEEKLALAENGKNEPAMAEETGARKEGIERELRDGSRLFLIDAGNDPELLGGRYADRSRYLILPAVARVTYYYSEATPRGENEPVLRGYLDLLTEEINVPRHLQGKFNTRPRAARGGGRPGGISENGLRYEVALQTGKRHEPWIAEVNPR
jgi:hypothetical protein